MMAEQIEIELKTLLTFEEYTRCIAFWQLADQKALLQANYYFDTADFQLKAKGCGLRIRTLSNQAELTLKTPLANGLLETTDTFSLTEIKPYLDSQTLPTTGSVAEKLRTLNIDISQLKLLASLTTKRYHIQLAYGEVALDESWYQKQHDYELELEVADFKQGQSDFKQLCQQLAIKYKPAQNKIARAFKAYGLS